jgi:hypothetical protein
MTFSDFLSVLSFGLGLVGAGGASALTLLHIKNATTITSIFQKVQTLGADVAVAKQRIDMAKETQVSLATKVTGLALQGAQDLGVPAKVMQAVQTGVAQAGALIPAGEAFLAAEAPSVEQHVHSVLDQVSQVTIGLAQLTKQMQAMPALTGAAASAAPPAGG